MTKLAIITDTAADLPISIRAARNIHAVPLYVTINDKSFRDGLEITSTELYGKMDSDKAIPLTSQPTPGDFCEAFTAALETAEEVLCLTLSSSISGTYQSAVLARELMDSPEKITIYDTQLASLGEGLMALRASDLAAEGKNAGDIVSELTRTPFKALFTVESLKYLERGGRISKTQASIANVLNIKPILAISASTEGKIETETKVRGRAKAIKYLLETLSSELKGDYAGYLGICNAMCSNEANEMQKILQEKYPKANIVTAEIGSTIGAHAGPGTVAVFFPQG